MVHKSALFQKECVNKLIIRMNKAPPNIIFKKKDKGGINLQVMVPQSELDLDLIKEILGEYRQGFITLGKVRTWANKGKGL